MEGVCRGTSIAARLLSFATFAVQLQVYAKLGSTTFPLATEGHGFKSF